jgi:hypothetical protein
VPGSAAYVRGRSEIAEWVDRQADDVLAAAVDGRKDEGRGIRTDRFRESKVQPLVVHMKSRPADDHGLGSEAAYRDFVDAIAGRRKCPPVLRDPGGHRVDLGDHDHVTDHELPGGTGGQELNARGGAPGGSSTDRRSAVRI